ncbi:MAG: hypothetical protein JWR14_6448 [Caballeronia sp.]|jgi:hypothetical protein|nr:hypothetical protein [Caballeronia sp.]
MPGDRHPAPPGFSTKHLRLWLESDQHSFERGCLGARFPPRHAFETAPVVKAGC